MKTPAKTGALRLWFGGAGTEKRPNETHGI